MTMFRYSAIINNSVLTKLRFLTNKRIDHVTIENNEIDFTNSKNKP